MRIVISPLRSMTRSELDAKLGYMLFRLTLGINFLLHSFVRWGNLEQFVNGLVADFAHTPLPAASVRVLAYVIPFWEPIVGVLLILGLLTRGALVLGALLLAVFTLGSACTPERNGCTDRCSRSVGLGDKDKAFEFLEQAYQERSPDVPYFLRADLRIDTLRPDP